MSKTPQNSTNQTTPNSKPFKTLSNFTKSSNSSSNLKQFQTQLTLILKKPKKQRDVIINKIKQSGTPQQVQSLNEFCLRQTLILIRNCTRILDNDVNQNMKSKDLKAAKRQAKATLTKAHDAFQLLLIQSKEYLNQAIARQMMQQEQQLSHKTIQYPIPQKTITQEQLMLANKQIPQSPSLPESYIFQSTSLIVSPHTERTEKVTVPKYKRRRCLLKRKPSYQYFKEKISLRSNHTDNQMNSCKRPQPKHPNNPESTANILMIINNAWKTPPPKPPDPFVPCIGSIKKIRPKEVAALNMTLESPTLSFQ